MPSCVASVMEVLGPDVTYDTPDPALAVAAFRTAGQGTGGLSYMWESDPLVAAMLAVGAEVPEPTADRGGARKGPVTSSRASPANPAMVVASNNFLDALCSGSGEKPVRVGAADASAPAPGSFTLAQLPAAARAECKAHMRELQALRAILQRPCDLFSLESRYDSLTDALASDNSCFVDYLVSQVEKIVRAPLATVNPEAQLVLTDLLCLYCEVLFFLDIHTRKRKSPGDVDGYELDNEDDPAIGCPDGTTPSSGAATPDSVVSRALIASAGLRSRLLSAVAFLSGEVSATRSPPQLQPRRCAVLLACACVANIGCFNDEDFVDAVATAQGRDNVLEICLMATLPQCMAGAGSTVTLFGAAAASGSSTHMQVVLATMRRTRIYSLDLPTLFREEGHAAPLLRDLAAMTVGAAMELVWEQLSPSIWPYFSKDALLSAAKGMSLYSWGWTRVPASAVGLLDLASGGLGAAVEALAAAEERRRRGGLSVDEDATEAQAHRRGAGAAQLSGLLAGAVGYSDGAGYNNTTEEATVAAGERPGTMPTGTAAFSRLTSDLFRFADPAHQVSYFLAVHAYTIASFTYAADCFRFLTDHLVWTVPLPFACKGPVSEITAPSGTHTPPQAADKCRLDWRALFPMPAAGAVAENGLECVNLLHQVLSYFTGVVHSQDMARLVASAPESFATCEAHLSAGSSVSRDGMAAMLAATLYDAGLTLMFHLFTAFSAREMGQVSAFAGVDMIAALLSVTHATLRPGAESMLQPRQCRLIYDLLQRFSNAFGNPEVPASQLLQQGLLSSLGPGQPTATSVAMDQLVLFSKLLRADESKRIVASRLFLSLVYLEPGVMAASREGLAFFALYLEQVFELLLTSEAGLLRLDRNGAATGVSWDNLTITKAVGNTYRLLPIVAPELVTALIARLSDGVAGLLRAHDHGALVACGSPVTRLLAMALQLQAEVVRLSGYSELLATLMLPPVPEFNDNHPVPASYYYLAAVFALEGLPADALVPAAQLLCAAVTLPGVSLLPVLRSHLSKPLRFQLATAIHQRPKVDVGSPANAVRMQVFRILSESDLATVQHFVGPDSLPVNKEAKELTELLIARVLSQLVLAGKGSSAAEKAAALRSLVALGLTDAVSEARALSLLDEASAAVAKGSSGPQACVLVDLVASASSFLAVSVCTHAARKGELWSVGGTAHFPDTPSQRGGSPRAAGSAHQQQQQQRAGSAGLPPPMSIDSGILAGGHDFGAILRRGSDCLVAAVNLYEHITKADFFFPDTSLQLSRSAAGASSLDVSSLNWDGSQLRLRTVTGSALALATLAATGLTTGNNTTGAAAGEARLTLVSSAVSRSRAERAVFHTDMLPDLVADLGARQDFLFPLLLGESYRYRPLAALAADEVVTGPYNSIVSLLVSMDSTIHAMENAMWLSRRDDDAIRVFVNRTSAVLCAALRCVLIAKPSAPALASALWVTVQCSLSLATAAAMALGTALKQLGRETSVSGGGFSPLDDSALGAKTHDGLLHLSSFLWANRRNLSVVNGCLPVFLALPATTVELGISEDVFRTVLDIVRDILASASTSEGELLEEIAFLRNAAAAFARFQADSCPLDVLTFLLPLLFRRAVAISNGIVAHDAAGPLTVYFEECLACIRGALLHSPDVPAAPSFLPMAAVMGLAEALGRFSCSAASVEGTGHVNRRQGWHVAWCGVLELLAVVVTREAHADSQGLTAGGKTWSQACSTMLPQLPRFLLALGAFTDVADVDRAYYLWDVEEMGVCTELVAVMAASGHPLCALLPEVTRGFLHTRRHRLGHSYIVTNALPETAARESSIVERTLFVMARDQLSYFLFQGSHGVPLSMLRPGDALVVVSLVDNLRDDEMGNRGVTVLTFDVLRHFIDQQLTAIRNANSDSATSTPQQSGRCSESPAGAGVSSVSRDSSLAATPSHFQHSRDTDTATEDDFGCTTDGPRATHAAENRALHIDIARLAMGLFTVAAEELVCQGRQLTGHPPSPAALRELYRNAEKLLRILTALKRDVNRLGSPNLAAMVTGMRDRLDAAVTKA